MSSIYTKVLSPVRTPRLVKDRRLFVNRDRSIGAIKSFLRTCVDDFEGDSAMAVVFGERGVGKTVCCREIVEQLRQDVGSTVQLLIADMEIPGTSDGLDICRKLVKKFAEGFNTLGSVKKDTTSFRQQLDVTTSFVDAESYSQAQLSNTMRQAGVKGEVSGGLWSVLQGKFGSSWQMQWADQDTFSAEFRIDELLLRDVLNALLVEATELDVVPLIFIDDIDRAAPVEHRESFVGIMKLLSDIKPAVMLIPMRPELRQDHFTRQATTFSLGGLEPDYRKKLLRDAIEKEKNDGKRDGLRERFSDEVVARLAEMTEVPYALLAWADAVAQFLGDFKGADTIEEVLKQWVQNQTTFTYETLVTLVSRFDADTAFLDEEAVSEDRKVVNELISSGIVEPDNLFADRKRVRLVSHFRFLKYVRN